MSGCRIARALPCLAAVAAVLLAADAACAQQQFFPQSTEHQIDRGPGNYLGWIPLACVGAVYLLWVVLADRVNRDALRYEDITGMSSRLWNPLLLGSFLGGLAAVLLIPWFVAGFPIFLLAALVPPILYGLMRRGKVPAGARPGEVFAEKIDRAHGPVVLSAAGNNEEQSQANLIRARQSPMYEATVALLHDSIRKRTEQILLDYTREAVAGREQVDGMWHPLPVMDRITGDGILVVLKSLANLNPAERRQVQKGQFQGKVQRAKQGFELQTQGTPNGERVLLKFVYEESQKKDLVALGMTAEMVSRLNDALHRPGMLIFSSPFGQGLSTTWQSVLTRADRLTRDWIAILDHDERETERENIDAIRYDSRRGETPVRLIRSAALKQPNVFVIPNPSDAATMDALLDQIQTEKRLVITQTRGQTAAESMLRMMSLAGDRKAFAHSVSMVMCQRLVRRLCDKCRQPVQLHPQAISQMRGDPSKGTTVYRHYQLPPPEARVGPDGKPIEMFPCDQCAGIGFLGRIAVFEQVVVDDEIRQVLLTQPRIEPVSKIIRQRGNLRIEEQAWRLVLEGVTSLNEVQRVFAPSAPSAPAQKTRA